MNALGRQLDWDGSIDRSTVKVVPRRNMKLAIGSRKLQVIRLFQTIADTSGIIKNISEASNTSKQT